MVAAYVKRGLLDSVGDVVHSAVGGVQTAVHDLVDGTKQVSTTSDSSSSSSTDSTSSFTKSASPTPTTSQTPETTSSSVNQGQSSSDPAPPPPSTSDTPTPSSTPVASPTTPVVTPTSSSVDTPSVSPPPPPSTPVSTPASTPPVATPSSSSSSSPNAAPSSVINTPSAPSNPNPVPTVVATTTSVPPIVVLPPPGQAPSSTFTVITTPTTLVDGSVISSTTLQLVPSTSIVTAQTVIPIAGGSSFVTLFPGATVTPLAVAPAKKGANNGQAAASAPGFNIGSNGISSGSTSSSGSTTSSSGSGFDGDSNNAITSHLSLPPYAIALIAVGGLVIVVAIIMTFFIARNRRRRAELEDDFEWTGSNPHAARDSWWKPSTHPGRMSSLPVTPEMQEVAAALEAPAVTHAERQGRRPPKPAKSVLKHARGESNATAVTSDDRIDPFRDPPVQHDASENPFSDSQQAGWGSGFNDGRLSWMP